MLQSSLFNDPPFDDFSSSENRFGPAKVDIRRRQVLQAFVIAPVVVMVDEGLDVCPEVPRQIVVL